MQYTVSYRSMEGNIIKDKKFHTKQEQEEEYQDRTINDRVLLNNEWHKVRYKRRIGDEFVIGVSEV